ncbi:FAD-dependent thymidylate synthase [Bacillus sp. NSP9.1]|uniref:FAD-dependent thymidylate synthase n=1 Tax=Bacillus sp. NSP9.1 TaxID=1071078 RepID=UPI0004213A64|nr:FAD-dependent thymidylate synthase [Bacillus sp. NSP9.1]QHZ45881.1 FAD-dependent thymidylate synthase [Bacillus sp. NSP9.1]
MNDAVSVLDRGYVRLTNVMGSDLSVVNSARVSYDKESTELSEKDIRLIKFLAREGHTSPFRHATVQLEIYAPLMVARQHWKYIVGSDHTMDAWNESSRRYVTEEPAFYIPQADEWRSAPESSKQGSGKPIDVINAENGYADVNAGSHYTNALLQYIDKGLELYDSAMGAGICAEQARLFLPAYGMYVRYYWTASLQSVAHFLNQRLAHDSQVEIQAYAKAVYSLVKPKFPISIDELTRTEV